MRSEGQIRQQLKQVAFRHLQKRLRANFRQGPDTCAHNSAVILGDGTTVGLCGFVNADGTSRNVPCDARIPGCSDMARQCPLWTPIQTKDEVKAEFAAIIQAEDRGVLASHYPDLAALRWVLDSAGATVTAAEITEYADKVEESPPPPHRWWGKFFTRLGGGG